MECPRCSGFGYFEDIPTSGETITLLHVFHCVVCGELLDPIILRNRWLTPAQRVEALPQGPRARLKVVAQ